MCTLLIYGYIRKHQVCDAVLVADNIGASIDIFDIGNTAPELNTSIENNCAVIGVEYIAAAEAPMGCVHSTSRKPLSISIQSSKEGKKEDEKHTLGFEISLSLLASLIQSQAVYQQ